MEALASGIIVVFFVMLIMYLSQGYSEQVKKYKEKKLQEQKDKQALELKEKNIDRGIQLSLLSALHNLKIENTTNNYTQNVQNNYTLNPKSNENN